MGKYTQNTMTATTFNAYIFDKNTRQVTTRTATLYVFGDKVGKYNAKKLFNVGESEALGKVEEQKSMTMNRIMLTSDWNTLAELRTDRRPGNTWKNVAVSSGWDVTGLFWNDSMTATVERTEIVGKKDSSPEGMLVELHREERPASGYTTMSAADFWSHSYVDAATCDAVHAAKVAKADAAK